MWREDDLVSSAKAVDVAQLRIERSIAKWKEGTARHPPVRHVPSGNSRIQRRERDRVDDLPGEAPDAHRATVLATRAANPLRHEEVALAVECDPSVTAARRRVPLRQRRPVDPPEQRARLVHRVAADGVAAN